ncbi:MAG: glycosyltransferase family 1 protein [Elusimicrobia bacterium]|nr:glycosyltransferase family 1 protein [Elusimicrobiota bacterium]
MRIALINLTGGGMCGGYRKYLVNMLPRLAGHASVDSVLCASPASLQVPKWFPPLQKVSFADCGTFRAGWHAPNSALEKSLRQFSPDVLFVPASRWVKFGDVPSVTMVQNMGPLVPMRGIGPWERLRRAAQYLETKLAARKADKVIAVSHFVKEYMVDRWEIAPDKISVVYFGARSSQETAVQPPVLAQCQPGHFIFTAGSIERYRGLEDLLGALEELAVRTAQPVKLVIGGSARKEMMPYFADLRRRAHESRLGSSVCWAGDLDSAGMAWCYAHCSAFVMTSKVEACPNIALEALAHGCQCIAADNPPLPEIFGGQAVCYKPGDSCGLAAAIELVLQRSSEEKDEIRRRTLVRAGQFSWDVAAEKTVQILSQAIA